MWGTRLRAEALLRASAAISILNLCNRMKLKSNLDKTESILNCQSELDSVGERFTRQSLPVWGGLLKEVIQDFCVNLFPV